MLAAEDFGSKDQLFSFVASDYATHKSGSLHLYPLLLNPEFTLQDALERSRQQGFRIRADQRGTDLIKVGLGQRISYETGYLVAVDSYWVFVSDGDTGALNSLLSAFSRAAGPMLKAAYLPSPHMLATIERASERYQRVLFSEGTIWTETQTFRTWRKDEREFNRKNLLKTAKRENGKWAGVSIKAINDDDEIFHARIYEAGHLTFYSGHFPSFWQDFVLAYLHDALEMYGRLAGKERRDEADKIVFNPVNFELPKMIDSLKMEAIRTALVKKYIAAVVHPGNPMLAMRLSDRDDGSSYDLYAYEKTVEIIPQQKSTAESLSKLVLLVSDVLPTAHPLVV